MTRISRLIPIAILFLTAILVVGRGQSVVSAQDASTVHPIVGTWLADADPEFTNNALDIFQFRADGTYNAVDGDGAVELGQWEATGESTANLFIVSTENDDDGNNLDTVIIRTSIEVAADGQSFSATYTFELVQPDGTTTGEIGPGTAIGDRIILSAQGTPVMTIDEAFELFEGDNDATPVP